MTGSAASAALVALLFLFASVAGAGSRPGDKPGSLSSCVRNAVDLGPAPRAHRHRIVVSLELRNRDRLEAFLADLHDPAGPDYRRFLTQEEFNALYAPAPADEEALLAHVAAHGLRVTHRAPNRLLVEAEGSVAAIEQAFGVQMRAVRWRGRRHRAPLHAPSLPAKLAPAVVGIIGLDDLDAMQSLAQPASRVLAPRVALGTDCCHLGPIDLAALYANAGVLDGTGETIVIAGAYAWSDADLVDFNREWGLPQLPPGSGQVCTGPTTSAGCRFNGTASIEVSMDAEYAHATAPGARIVNYMAGSTAVSDFLVMYNRIVTDDPGHLVSTSWGGCEADIAVASQRTYDNIFANANAIGQSWLASSGDGGSRCNGRLSVDTPANSPHVIGVGGTTPTCSSGMTATDPACAGYGGETGWSGSGGGASRIFPRPDFQAGCLVPAGTERLVPDVALAADPSLGLYVLAGGQWYTVGGTSGAVPQWAGVLAQFDQQHGGVGLGHPGPLLYGLCGTSAFHDVIAGSNGDYAAGPGYDLVTGLGSVDVAAFLALATPTTTTTSTSTTSTTTTLPVAAGTLSTRVAARSDDAEESAGGRMKLGSRDLELVRDSNDQTVGIRFAHVTIPHGAVIDSAHVQFQANRTSSEPTSLTVAGQLIPDAPTFTSAIRDISSRTLTAARVPWTVVPAWPRVGAAGARQRTGDLKNVIQEIVDQDTWSTGNALVIVVTGTGRRWAESYDHKPAGAATLRVQYHTGAPVR